jgi:hypothetical protein
MNWDRKGPPRPKTDRGGHPVNFEKPYVHKTAEDRAKRRRELAEEKKSISLVRKSAEWEALGRSYPLTDEDRALIEKQWGHD